MVKIVTGKMDSSKTTRIEEMYDISKKGDGIISKKVMLDKDVFGYNALRLSDKLDVPFMLHEKYYKQDVLHNGRIYDKDFCGEIGPYKIFKKSLKIVHKMYKEFFKANLSPIYFDEIGMLEMNKGGFYKPLKTALKKDIDIVITVREDLIDKVLNKFNITEYEILK